MSMRRSRPRPHSRQESVEYPRYPPLNSPTQQPPPIEAMPSATNLQPIQPSDYESDNQGYTSDYPVMRPPITRTKEEMNLTVLQKHNPEIVQILSVAPYATIYDWAHTPGEWQKTGPNGTLFICQMTPGDFGQERYHAIVLNRSGLDNFNAELRQSEYGNVEASGDFVIITQEPQGPGGEPKLNAVHIFSEEGTSTAASRIANGELMVALSEAAKRSRDAAMGPIMQANGAVENSDPVRSELQSIPQQLRLVEQSQQTETEPGVVSRPPGFAHPFAQSQPISQQPSPVHHIAPQPSRQVDLLSLFQSQQSRPQSDIETAPARPPPPLGNDANNLLRLLQGGGGGGGGGGGNARL